jgi:hypothetical protein
MHRPVPASLVRTAQRDALISAEAVRQLVSLFNSSNYFELLTSSNFMFFPFLPFPACFFLHLSGSGKKQGGTVKGTERSPKEGGRA